MVDAVIGDARTLNGARKTSGLRRIMGRKSTKAFLMALPLIVLLSALVLYPALYALHLATLNKSMERFVGFGNFLFLFKRETFWMVVKQSCIFAITAVIFKALIGFIVAHFVHNIPGQGSAQVARHAAGAVGDPAGDEHARLAVAVRSVLQRIQLDPGAVRHRADRLDRRRLLGALLGDPGQRLVRRAVLPDHVSGGAQVRAGAALRGGRDRRRQLVAAHLVRDLADDAQHHRHHGAVLADRDVRQLRYRARS